MTVCPTVGPLLLPIMYAMVHYSPKVSLPLDQGEYFMADGDGNGTASNAIWAVAMIIIVALIAGAVYYSGILTGGSTKKVDVDVSVPAR